MKPSPGCLIGSRGMYFLIKKSAFFVLVSFIASCAPQQEIVKPLPKVIPPPVAPVTDRDPVEPLPKPYRQAVACEERTSAVFNQSGLEVVPFARLVFFDMDGDGSQDLIAGGKDGSLRLYKRRFNEQGNSWAEAEGYFQGKQAGAFSSPAAADIDLDGNPEIIIGTGGFSSESGRIIIFRNTATRARPVWQRVDMPVIDVGDDATPTVADVNGDGKADIIAGNSTGSLMLYRNRTIRGKVSFARDPDFFKGVNIGMYAMPAAAVINGRIVIIAGNSMGKLYLIEKQNAAGVWQKSALKMEFSHFAAPAFMKDSKGAVANLIVSDGNGRIYYYKNSRSDFRAWEEVPSLFADRLMPGPVCTPSVCELGGKSVMVTGNVNGELRLFEYQSRARELPWIEKKNFFDGIKLPGYARGTLVIWKGRNLLVTGQHDGHVRAFLNMGEDDRPIWQEQKDFFRGVPRLLHASPAVFDLDGDGAWELIVGDVDGNVTAYRMQNAESGMPYWSMVEGVFSSVRADRYASPSLARDDQRIYLFVGQQDGAMRLYSADSPGKGMPVFLDDDILKNLQFSKHSSPSVVMNKGVFELSVGDYNGNLRHFACRLQPI